MDTWDWIAIAASALVFVFLVYTLFRDERYFGAGSDAYGDRKHESGEQAKEE